MVSKQYQVLINVDLDQAIFAAVSDAYVDQCLGATANTILWSALEDIQIPPDCSYAAIFFFERRASDAASAIDQTARRVRSTLSSFENMQILHALTTATLVDCGDKLNVPLSGFQVIGQLVEELDGAASREISGTVFAADYPSEDDEAAAIVIRDTSKPEFLDHMAMHIAKSLEGINKNQATRLPEFGDTTSTDLTAALAAVLDEALDREKKD